MPFWRIRRRRMRRSEVFGGRVQGLQSEFTMAIASKKKATQSKKPKAKVSAVKSRKLMIAGILALVVVAGSLVYVGNRYRNKRRDNVWKADGIAASRAGDHERGAELLGRFITRHPGDTEAI